MELKIAFQISDVKSLQKFSFFEQSLIVVSWIKADYLRVKSHIAGTLLSLRARVRNQPWGGGWLADETLEDKLQTLQR